MKKLNTVRFTALALVALSFVTYAYAAAVPTVNLGSTEDFSVLAGSTITNTGSTVTWGDLGLSPGTAVTGFPPGTIGGSQHVADADAIEAKNDLVTAYTDARGRTPATSIGTEMGGTTILPGVYTSGTLGITGTVTLDAQGDPNAVFIFKAASTLVTAASSKVVLAGDAQACNIFWQVGSSATLGANSDLKGTILALTSVTLTTGADVEGRVFARNGAVTLDSNNITEPGCELASAVTPEPEPTTTPEPEPTTTPEPEDEEEDVEPEVDVIVEVGTSVETVATGTVTTIQINPVTVTPSLPDTGSKPIYRNVFLMFAILALGSGILILNTGVKRNS